MIKRFHVLYVGQIDLDNIGLDGTPANERRYPTERLGEVFWTARRIARVMDELGYYAFGPPSTTSSTKATNACRT